MRKVDFFVAGYPKCGTTALYQYLNDHPMVFLPPLKEPHFFSEDFPGARVVTTDRAYCALYRNAQPQQLLGDASASVIHSTVAAKRILEINPAAKFIVLVREPVSSVRAFHGELLRNLTEDEPNFERAWRLQVARAAARCIPATCREPRFLQYNQIFHYREQLPALVALVPESQRLVLIFEEFFADPRAGYRQVLDFLGLADDRRSAFEPVNAARQLRFRGLSKLHRRVVARNGSAYRSAKHALGAIGIHPSHALAAWNVRKRNNRPLSVPFALELRSHFQTDIDTVEHLMGREISSWSI